MPPSLKQLNSLTERGVAAYAVRYAQRVMPLFPDPVISHAIRQAELSVSGLSAGDLYSASESALLAGRDAHDRTSKHVAVAASKACLCAAHSADGYSDPDAVNADVMDVIRDAETQEPELLRMLEQALHAAEMDLRVLTSLGARASKDAVNLDALGPLWPDWVPPWCQNAT